MCFCVVKGSSETPPLPSLPKHTAHTETTHIHTRLQYSWVQEGRAGGRLLVCGLHCKPNPSHPASPHCVPVRAPNHILMYGQASRGESSTLRRAWAVRLDQRSCFISTLHRSQHCHGRRSSLEKSQAISNSCLHLVVKGHSNRPNLSSLGGGVLWRK